VTGQISAGDAGTIKVGHRVVNRLGFGAMRITGRGVWGDPPDPEAARALLRTAVKLDVNFIDTAYAYGPEVSERLIAEALHPYPPDLLITTKSGQQRGGSDVWYPDGRPGTLRRELERSLTILRRDRIDLFQLHRPDPSVPIQESVGELVRLQDEGKIDSIGVSNVTLDQLHEAETVADIRSVQNQYSLFDRSSEDIVTYCEEKKIVFIPWYPLGGGSVDVRGEISRIAKREGLTVARLALAWLLRRSPWMLPIPGTSSATHLVENVSAASVELTFKTVEQLEQLE
jgi:aryl-alcohol dehydrogenase-like predicted oxidoreductase